MDKKTHLAVGTAKGLIIYRLENETLVEKYSFFHGLDISALHNLPNGNLLAAISHKHWGEKLNQWNAQTNQWTNLNVPKFPEGLKTVTGKQASLKKIWSLHHGGNRYPERILVGTEPGALFISEDGGNTYEICIELWNHPTRIKNKQWFGAGKDLPFIHSILLPENTGDEILLSVSCAGVFYSSDAGNSWECRNVGMRAAYLPNPTPFAGYDPHCMVLSQVNHSVLWQQNHCGVYYSNDKGMQWYEVSGKNRFPEYGFAISIEENATDEAWVIPVEDETQRIPTGMKLRVLHTFDQGRSWSDQSQGLPKRDFYGIVLRNGFVKYSNHMAFGTTNGNLYYSPDKGKHWSEISTHLAKVSFLCFL